MIKAYSSMQLQNFRTSEHTHILNSVVKISVLKKKLEKSQFSLLKSQKIYTQLIPFLLQQRRVCADRKLLEKAINQSRKSKKKEEEKKQSLSRCTMTPKNNHEELSSHSILKFFFISNHSVLKLQLQCINMSNNVYQYNRYIYVTVCGFKCTKSLGKKDIFFFVKKNTLKFGQNHAHKSHRMRLSIYSVCV